MTEPEIEPEIDADPGPETEPEAAAEPETPAPPPPLDILLYASDRTVREHVRLSLGRKVATDLPEVRVLEVATQPAVITAMDRGGIALAILDGEAVPGGLGLGRQLKDEIANCPPILVLTGRRDDAWLATWSRADGVLPHPVDPLRLPETVARLLRLRTRITAS
ncbi:MAG TPA: response regulator [Microlunatus sp.]